MKQKGIGRFRIALFFDNFKFSYTPWSDCHELQLGFLHLGWIPKK